MDQFFSGPGLIYQIQNFSFADRSGDKLVPDNKRWCASDLQRGRGGACFGEDRQVSSSSISACNLATSSPAVRAADNTA